MIDAFLVRAALAGLGVALATGPLGAFVVWRRMAYFGDATSHAAVLGVALALGTGVPVFGGTLAVALLMALAVSILASRGHAMDTTLGVLSHSALALGLVAVSFVTGVRVDLEAFLFGDILAVSWADVALIWGGAAVVAGLVAARWSRLLTMTLSADLAQSAGINPKREGLILTLAMAVVVAVALKVVGALLIAALLIIPSAAARLISRSPEQMATLSSVIAALAVIAGLGASWTWDTPAGPSIVVSAGAVFLILQLRPKGAKV
ncbi:High-affinity zinc uptake system membrane protein ZnuB [Aquimixticola soesokkakensis]|uniref:High-affinity zinc uptake system membrane protein ZnuB n=1 Tax=Aquimixticola soesokkakensis TaxID=1519096 RepID=A0A1Y5RK81_9RHOB|nr:iron chelate uptake ABC transporter family permease subunit [Aquimixticola soesokkakensis]SLN19425.1 High-affinity zinc uptake system membrane protein ZnuB [Aquimixticola soesokkakensis]